MASSTLCPTPGLHLSSDFPTLPNTSPLTIIYGALSPLPTRSSQHRLPTPLSLRQLTLPNLKQLTLPSLRQLTLPSLRQLTQPSPRRHMVPGKRHLTQLSLSRPTLPNLRRLTRRSRSSYTSRQLRTTCPSLRCSTSLLRNQPTKLQFIHSLSSIVNHNSTHRKADT